MNFTFNKYNRLGLCQGKPNVQGTETSNKLQYPNQKEIISARKPSNIDLPRQIEEKKSIYDCKQPRTEFRFENKLMKRCNSSGKMLMQQYKDNSEQRNIYNGQGNNDSKDVSQINNRSNTHSNVSNIQQYLDRRHYQTLEKVNKMRMDKYNKDASELRFVPQISEKSKKIVEKLLLRDQISTAPHNDTPIAKMSRNHSNTSLRTTNEKVSNKLKKTINDLTQYKQMIEKRAVYIKEEEEKNKHSRTNLNTIDRTLTNPTSCKRAASANPSRLPTPVDSRPKSSSGNEGNTNFRGNQDPHYRGWSFIERCKNVRDVSPIKRNWNPYEEVLQYQKYNEDEVMEARSKLNNYYIEKKEKLQNEYKSKYTTNFNAGLKANIQKNDYLYQQEYVPPDNKNNLKNFQDNKNLFVLNKEDPVLTKPEPVKIIKCSEKNKQDQYKLPLPEEKIVDVRVDFNELDQFSPPYNGPVNLQYLEKKNPNSTRTESYASNLINKRGQIEDLGSKHIQRQDQLSILKTYADSLSAQGTKKAYYTLDEERNIYHKTNGRTTGGVNTITPREYLVQDKEKTAVRGNFVRCLDQQIYQQEQYKLDPTSKNFALERLKEIRSNVNNNMNTQLK